MSDLEMLAALNYVELSRVEEALRRDVRCMVLREVCEYMKRSPENSLRIRRLYHRTTICVPHRLRRRGFAIAASARKIWLGWTAAFARLFTKSRGGFRFPRKSAVSFGTSRQANVRFATGK